ncbi:TPA: hypothetical protein JAG59_001835 [Legionella pneumophila]|nr:hypothetical protein [Legionella pneumophila]HAT5924033.1 hypothetical protein [Legionella pneumophila]HAT5936358.1 hypothetical protein [Legionella pneumophila]HAT5951196.1 hypothetical protein [Legionella pneumophila]HAT5961763.1 hypothetical protein [Legionella pneumophila]
MVVGILWVISILSTLLAFINYVLTEPQNVMQQAALASMTIVYILIPYCLARALMAINQIDSQNNKDKVIDNLLVELQNISNRIEQSSSKLTSTLLLSEKINRISLIHKICFFDEAVNHSHESISWRINCLKSMSEENIITIEEFELLKKQLFTKFEQFLKQKLESNK